MSASIIKLVPDEELSILDAYIAQEDERELEGVYDDFGVPEGSEEVSRCSIAVAQILLHNIQEELPSWGCTRNDGTVVLGRLRHKRHQDARLNFNPKHVLTVNWADSGPGFSWPEAYYITYLPKFNKHIVTASRDGEDAFGCTDHAIGFADGDMSLLDAAKEIIISNWLWQRKSWGQARWAYLFDEGFINAENANEWASEVWLEAPEDGNGCTKGFKGGHL